MNSLEKIFNSIRTSNTKEMKLFTTHELIKQLSEYEDYSLYILKSIYSLITSDVYLNRICGAKILQSINFFKYQFDFKLSDSPVFSDFVYLQFQDIKEGSAQDLAKQRSEIKKKLSAELEHIEPDFLDDKDMEKIVFNIKLKTSENKEKEISNIFDFFEALNMILLSPDWNKRHGAFIAYSAIIASESDSFDFDFDMKISKVQRTDEWVNLKKPNGNATKISLTGDLFNKIFEILKNDKFNDFQDDATSSPVREAACILLKYIYPMINNTLILHEITHLLSSNDWQEQFSALLALSQLKDHFNQDLIDGKNLIDNFFQILINQLDSSDEDVKFLSADLISFIIENFTINNSLANEIKESCWNQVDSDIDIAHSKASLLILLKTIYSKFHISPPSSFASLYPCFTSPISIIRNSALELSKVFEAEEFLYLLAEGILLETSSEYKNEILKDKIKKCSESTLLGFAEHFLRIISLNIHLPYNEDDFACYDDTFFTSDGIKSLGSVALMNNRSCLFSEIIKIEGLEIKKEGKNQCLLLEAFQFLYLANVNELNINNSFIVLVDALTQNIESDFKKYNSLKKMPIKEFLKIIQEFEFLSLYPLAYDNCLELIRKYACEYIFEISDFNLYFRVEKSDKFMSIFCEILIKSPLIESITSKLIDQIFTSDQCLRKIQLEKSFAPPKSIKKNSQFLKGTPEDEKSHEEIVHEQIIFNIQIFFQTLGISFLKFKAFLTLMENPDRLTFFKYTIKNYLQSHEVFSIFNPIFYDALEKRNIAILKTFISNIDFNCIFVNCMIEKFDLYLVTNLIEFSDPSFNVLFVKLILKNINSSDNESKSNLVSDIRTLLSTVIGSLHFSVNKSIKDQKLIDLIEKEKEEVKMIVDPKLIKDYEMKIPISITLRDYQREGIRWISFLGRFNLNGILADDMGLGKTVQMLSYVMNEMYLLGLDQLKANEAINQVTNNQKSLDHNDNQKSQDNDQVSNNLLKTNETTNQVTDDQKLHDHNDRELQDHVIRQSNYLLTSKEIVSNCPLSTLIICPSSLTSHWKDEIKTYFGVESTIFNSKKEINTNVVICSYDLLRRDNGTLENKKWFVIIFDEGHLLKNRNTVLFTKAKKLTSQKRFILTGTPIHNSVEDLYSLFDILMPNYLGNESSFISLYGCKVTDKNVEVMKLRLECLHKKTLPFIMRRLKTEVLKDLPPKIITDLTVEMNPSQADLYKKLGDQNSNDIDQVETKGYATLKNYSLVTIKNQLKIASHPHYFDRTISSSKTAALQDIISMSGNSKILIFFQFRATIDYVLADLNLANYLRLDGSVPPNLRGEIVRKFNTEDIPYLFLTTSIGGLGLNLTSANIVVFYEHDWNPFNDLQAMDRAHRLGQKLPVNVFRLICKGTVEETVMNYQNFKLYVANSIITQQNNEIGQMDTKDILERFQE